MVRRDGTHVASGIFSAARNYAPILGVFFLCGLAFFRQFWGPYRRGIGYSREEPWCNGIETNVTCLGDGVLLSDHVRDSGVYVHYTHATITEGITSIASKAFYGCYNLYSIDLPSSVASLEDTSFQETAFRTFTIGKTVICASRYLE